MFSFNGVAMATVFLHSYRTLTKALLERQIPVWINCSWLNKFPPKSQSEEGQAACSALIFGGLWTFSSPLRILKFRLQKTYKEEKSWWLVRWVSGLRYLQIKPENPSSIPEPHVAKGKRRIPKLSSDIHTPCGTYTPTHAQTKYRNNK